MKKSTLSMAAAFVTVAGMTAAIVNCDSDDAKATGPSQVAHKGEACQTTNDCAPGLACAPQAFGSGNGANVVGVCVLAAFSVSQTAKECATIDCQAATDCCPTPPTDCATRKTECDAEADAGLITQPDCAYYNANCVCDPAQIDCQNGKCVTKCLNDSTCAINRVAGKCLGGVCGGCSSDTDCNKNDSNKICNSGQCQNKCQGDGDCPGFDRCVGGKCTPGACQTDRECIAYSRNVEATCGTDGKCVVPCQTDLECGNPKDYRFYSCIAGKCTYMGCGNDKDCELALGSSGQVLTIPSGTSSGSSGTSGSSGSSSKQQHIVCRDVQTPNPRTIAPTQ